MERTAVIEHVNRYTRASQHGRVIICPNCNFQSCVYHFRWCGLGCKHCAMCFNKEEWLVAVTRMRPQAAMDFRSVEQLLDFLGSPPGIQNRFFKKRGGSKIFKKNGPRP